MVPQCLPCFLQAAATRSMACQSFSLFPLGEDAEHLREVAGADEEQIDAVDGGDRVALFERAERFDLDGDEVVAVGVGGKLRQRFAAVGRVVPAAVQAAVAARGELDPLHELLGMLGRFDAGRHQAAGAGFEVGGRHRHSWSSASGRTNRCPFARPGRRGQADLLVGDAGVLLVDPKAVIAADHAMHVEHDRVDEAADAEDAAELVLGEAGL